MNREEAEKVLNAIDFKDGDNIVIINKNVCDKMKNEKQQLINWLEDKIKKCDVFMQMCMNSLNKKYTDKKDEEIVKMTLKITIRECEIEIKALQEVLDFINKGGKE